jgi:cytochrome c554/c'-like protein
MIRGLAAALLLASVRTSSAQKGFIGPAKCIDCHDHDYHANWWKKEDGTTKGGRVIRHFNSLNRLEEPNSAKYAKAVGLADVYDPAGSCVKCHASVYKGEANAGVSCESCHGGASGYLEPHKEKGAYKQAVAAGMRDIMSQPKAWAPDCMRCHVMDSKTLIDAGHPSGDEFNIAEKFRPVAKHWQGKYGQNTGYSPDQIVQLAAPARARIIAQRNSGGGPQTTVVATTSIAVAVTSTVPPTTTGPTGSATGPTTIVQPPTTVAGKPTTPTTIRRSGAPVSTTSVTTIPVTAPPTVPTTSVAGPVLDATGNGLPPPQLPALPPTPAGAVAAVQGRLIALLNDLLTSGARTPTRVVPPQAPTEYGGMDADLLQLQEETISLALQALSVAPTTPAAKGAPPKP